MSDAQRLEQIRERAAAAIKRDPSWQLLTDDIPWMDAAINRLLAVKDQRQHRIGALEAENARLRDALEVCVEAISDGVRELPRGGMTGGGEPFHLISPTWKNFHLALTRARAALAASAGEG